MAIITLFAALTGYHANRKACSNAGVHTSTVAGISGTAEWGAYSVVLSSGYEDDEDSGETL
jgi:E3 ubiquitin-protein ligase UHRF1